MKKMNQLVALALISILCLSPTINLFAGDKKKELRCGGDRESGHQQRQLEHDVHRERDCLGQAAGSGHREAGEAHR